MKKALIIAYAKKNLGDDLFIYLLANRYKDVQFYLASKTIYEKDNFNLNNLKIIYPDKFKEEVKVNKSLQNLNLNLEEDININEVLSRICDVTILIGGSMFIENIDLEVVKKQIEDRFLNLENKYYILGSNFGPYVNEEYYNLYYEVFKNAEDVCFREEYSYNLFKDLENIRYESDIVFSMDVNDIKIKKDKEVVISVIDLSGRKELKEYKEIYENKTKEMINHFNTLGYKITLMSFCKAEGDEEAIDRILEGDETNTSVYRYSGNIKEALEIMAKCDIIVGARFHAMILGLILKKTVIPIIYSEKTTNVIKDINFQGDYISIKDLNNLDVKTLNLDYKLDISKEIISANKHFINLDKFLIK